MNKQEFTYLLTNPKALTDAHTSEVGDIVTKYPYFQAARALYLKGLKTKESFKYNQELKITAAYTTDRSILFDFITSEAFNQNEISKLIKQNIDLLKAKEIDDAIVANKSAIIDASLDQYMKDSDGVLDPDLFQQKHAAPNLPTKSAENRDVQVDEKKKTTSAEEQLKLGKPLDFDKSETHSFTEWLNITSFKPIQRADEAIEKIVNELPITQKSTKQETGLEKKIDLIDRFLNANPKISPIKDSLSSINLAHTKLVQNDSFMTETLARIYLEQKNYEKAIQSYRILILKYPEKSSFFADQIKAVKQIQANNTK